MNYKGIPLGGWSEMEPKVSKKLLRKSLDAEIKRIMKNEKIPELSNFSDKFKVIYRTNFIIKSRWLAENFDWQFLNWHYQGIREADPSGKVLEVLNADEIAALCVGTYIVKNKELVSRENLEYISRDGLIEHTIVTGMPSLNKRKNLLQKYLELDKKINPYKRFKLKDRLSAVSRSERSTLKYNLSKSPRVYIPECKYYSEKALRGGDDSNLEIIYFLPVYPKKGHDYRKRYAREIMRILKNKYRAINK